MELSTAHLATLSPAYKWVLDKGIAGHAPFTQLQPWYFLPDDEIFDVTQKWPSGRDEIPLIAFARRQDCDDIACLELSHGNSQKVVLIEGWAAGAYSVISEYPTFWEWLKSVMDDVADWSALPGKQ